MILLQIVFGIIPREKELADLPLLNPLAHYTKPLLAHRIIFLAINQWRQGLLRRRHKNLFGLWLAQPHESVRAVLSLMQRQILTATFLWAQWFRESLPGFFFSAVTIHYPPQNLGFLRNLIQSLDTFHHNRETATFRLTVPRVIIELNCTRGMKGRISFISHFFHLS